MAIDIEEGLVSLLGADPSLVMGRGIGSAAPSPAAPPPSTVMLGAPAPTAAPTAAPTSPSAFAAAPDGFPYAAERDWWLSGGPESMGKALLLEADRQRGPDIFSPWYAEIRRRGLMNKQAGGSLEGFPVLPPVTTVPIAPPPQSQLFTSAGGLTSAQPSINYSHYINMLKSNPLYQGASFAGTTPEVYNRSEENITPGQGLSPLVEGQNPNRQSNQLGLVNKQKDMFGEGISSLGNITGTFAQ